MTKFETIICPACQAKQRAKLVCYDGISAIKAHKCKKCNYFITGDEWSTKPPIMVRRVEIYLHKVVLSYPGRVMAGMACAGLLVTASAFAVIYCGLGVMIMERENSVQLSNDWIGSSFIVIDGVHFAPTGFDNECGFSSEDLDNGLQKRIHDAVNRAGQALNLEVL